MVTYKKHYELQQKSKEDKLQIRFDKHGWLQKPEPPKVEQSFAVNPTEKMMCPFCLVIAPLSRFFVSTKKGISQGKAQCPECKSGMLMRTLLADMTAEQYAKWVFNYRSSGFWQKCPFDKWKVRLKQIGWAGEFWDVYKELKADADIQKTLDGSEKTAEEYEEAYKAYEESYDE